MSQLIVIGYPDSAAAERARDELLSLSNDCLTRLSEVVVAARDGNGKLRLNHVVDFWTLGTALGSIGGLLLGVIFLHPIFGVLVGAAAGTMRGVLTDSGIDEDFVKALAELLRPGQAALLLRRDLIPERDVRDEVIEKLAASGGRVLKTDLAPNQERRLREAFEGAYRSVRAESQFLHE
jgi:uncharacterized membrane protein